MSALLHCRERTQSTGFNSPGVFTFCVTSALVFQNAVTCQIPKRSTQPFIFRVQYISFSLEGVIQVSQLLPLSVYQFSKKQYVSFHRQGVLHFS